MFHVDLESGIERRAHRFGKSPHEIIVGLMRDIEPGIRVDAVAEIHHDLDWSTTRRRVARVIARRPCGPGMRRDGVILSAWPDDPGKKTDRVVSAKTLDKTRTEG